MLYLDEDLISHPKLLRAGDLLGGIKADGLARALTLWLAGISYARKYLTDGVVSGPFVASCGAVRDPLKIASVLVDERVKLWTVDPAGYRIHDFHDWNKPADAERRKREGNRTRQAKWRAVHGGNGRV